MTSALEHPARIARLQERRDRASTSTKDVVRITSRAQLLAGTAR